MARVLLLACIVAVSLMAGCLDAPRGPLIPHGHLEVSADRTLVTVHLDFYNKADLPIEFPSYPTGEAANAVLHPMVSRTGGQRVEFPVIDGPTDDGPIIIFNGSDVIPPRTWWNTTFHVKYDVPLRSPWLLTYNANLEYRVQNGPGHWSWSYSFPCYDYDGNLSTTAQGFMCDDFTVFQSESGLWE